MKHPMAACKSARSCTMVMRSRSRIRVLDPLYRRAHTTAMRPWLRVTLVAFFIVGASGPSASAASPQGTIGKFNGQTVVEFGTHGCSFVYQTHTATYRDRSGGTGRFALAGCVAVGTGFTYSGRLVLTPPGGAAVRGTVVGTVYGTTPPFPCADPTVAPASLQFTLTPNVGPVINLLGTWCPDAAQGTIVGVLTN